VQQDQKETKISVFWQAVTNWLEKSRHEDWRLFTLVFALLFGCLLRQSDVFSSWLSSSVWGAGVVITLILMPFLAEKARFSVAVFIALLLGIALSSHRIEQISTETIKRESFVKITGILDALEYRPSAINRLTIRVSDISSQTWLVGEKLRLSVRTHIPKTLKAGAEISVDAVLDGMAGAIVPRGFDFETYLQRQGIAAQGFAVSPIVIINQGSVAGSLQSTIQNIRDDLSKGIYSYVDPRVSGVAVSITTGQRNFLDPKTARLLRDSGLAHLLAISGLHMGLVTAAAFFVFELLFAALPMVANRILPRKGAAVFAWIVAIIYLGISGASVSTIRAFIMVSIAILALLTDRRVISLRSVALAAAVVTVFDPLAILSISFQMSFAATTGLVVIYDFITSSKLERRRENVPYETPSGWTRYLVFPAGIAGTSLVAQAAIAPLALYHFQALSLIGIGVNILAVPVMAFIVMPAAFLGVLCMSFGIEPAPFWVMEQGLFFILELAELSVSMPFAVYRSGPFSGELLGLTFMAYIFICFYRSKKVFAAAIISVGIGMIMFRYQAADILIDNEGRVIAHRLSATKIEMAGGRAGGFRDLAWKRYWGMEPNTERDRLAVECDSRACGYRIQPNPSHQPDASDIFQIVRTENIGEVRRACTFAAVVIASFRQKQSCKGGALFLAKEDIERMGPVGIWFDSDKLKILKVEWSNPNKRYRP
jgi:competence protein ComEC